MTSRTGPYRGAWWWRAGWWALAGLALAAHWRVPTTLIDDALITLRYSANWARGWGLVFNPGEWVLGTTTPGYALLVGSLAALLRLDPTAIPWLARGVNWAALCLAAWSLGALAHRLTGRPAARLAAAALVFLSPATLLASVAGMESALFLGLLCAGGWAAGAGRWRLLAALAGLLPLVRPEGVFALGLVALGAFWALWRRPAGWRNPALAMGGVLALGPGLVWAVIAWQAYGSPLPHSITAKTAGLYPIGVVGSVVSFGDWLLRSLFAVRVVADGTARAGLVTGPAFVALFGLAVAGLGLGLWRLRGRWPHVGVAGAFVALTSLFHATSQTLVFPHYHALYEALVKGLWWSALYGLLTRALPRWPARARLGVTLALTLAPGVWLYPWQTVLTGASAPAEVGWQAFKQHRYFDLTQALAHRVPAGTVALMPEIGELGFYLPDVVVLDSAGLVSPAAVAFLPPPPGLAPGGVPPALVRAEAPALVITAENFIRPGLAEDAWFLAHYTPVIVADSWRLPGDFGRLYVWSRNDFPPGMALATPAP